MHDPRDHHEVIDVVETPLSVRHAVQTLSAYWAVIGMALAAVALGYIIVAALIMLMSPSNRITSVPFRLDFEGATAGHYPNGLKFRAADIVSTPVLNAVYTANRLDRFTKLREFQNAVFVLESNRALDRISAEYQARLGDPRLTPLDRERIQKEFEAKRDSLAKNEYSINYSALPDTNIPASLVPKILSDALETWADRAAKELRVKHYQVAMLSKGSLERGALEKLNYVVAIQVLRAKIGRILENIDRLRRLPGAELARTKGDDLSLLDLESQLDGILRFRVEPLIGTVRSSGLLKDLVGTRHFLEAQLAHDRRVLAARQGRVDAVRNALNAMNNEPMQGDAGSVAGAVKEPAQRSASSETVTPQVSESFIDRLLALSRQSFDVEQRQRLINDLRRASDDVIPAQQAVQTDLFALEQIGTATGSSLPQSVVDQEIESTYAELARILSKVNELYVTISRAANPAAELYTVSGAPTKYVERTVRPDRVILWGILTLALALPLIVAACFLHNRVREEEHASHPAQAV